MKRTLSLLAVCVGLAAPPAAVLSSGTASAATIHARAARNERCHARNYQFGSCKHIPRGRAGSVKHAGPRPGDKDTVLHVPATSHALDVTANKVAIPGKVKHAVAAFSISVVNADTNVLERHYAPPLALTVDPKYTVCSYKVSTGACTPVKMTHGKYAITGPGTYVLVAKK